MIQPTLDLNSLGANTPEPMSLKLPTEFPEKNRKAHVSGDPDPDPSLSDSSLKKYNSLNDSIYSQSKKIYAIRKKASERQER